MGCMNFTHTRIRPSSSNSLDTFGHGKADRCPSIVAIHGLNGHPFDTWSRGGQHVNWLQDKALLPESLSSARILTRGYNANVTALLGSTSSDRILQHAQTLVAQLEANRSVRSEYLLRFCTVRLINRPKYSLKTSRNGQLSSFAIR